MDKPTFDAPAPAPLQDLVRTLQVGGCFGARIGHRRMTVEVKLIASKGEYASWGASRATASKPGRAEAESGIPAGHQAPPSFARSPVEIAAHAGPQPRHLVDRIGVDRECSQVEIAARMALVGARLRRGHPDLEKHPLTVTAEHRSSMDVVTAKLMKLARGFVIFIFASVLLNGCSAAGAPSFELFGAFFPAWLFCGLIGLVASGAARGLFVSTGLSQLLPYQLFVCVAIGVIAACLAWLLWFGW